MACGRLNMRVASYEFNSELGLYDEWRRAAQPALPACDTSTGLSR